MFLPKPGYEAEFRFANLLTINDELYVSRVAIYNMMGAGLAKAPPLFYDGHRRIRSILGHGDIPDVQ